MNTDVSVIGAGSMGSTLARLLLRAGHRVSVWNRTSAGADALVREGAARSASAAAAVGASPIVVVCVHDYQATHEIFRSHEVASALPGRVVVQLTTGSPQEARDAQTWVWERGGEYLDGAIQAAPSQMGQPDTPIFVSGAAGALRKVEPVLAVFGGGVTWLGEDVAAASAMDLATLSYVYGAALGFFHGARVCESQGIRVDAYGRLVAAISPSFGKFFEHEGAVIQSGDFAVSESPLKISVEATERIARQAREAGIDAEVPTFVAALFQRAAAAGLGDQELAAMVKLMRGAG